MEISTDTQHVLKLSDAEVNALYDQLLDLKIVGKYSHPILQALIAILYPIRFRA